MKKKLGQIPSNNRFWDARTRASTGAFTSITTPAEANVAGDPLVERRQTKTIEFHPSSDDIRSVLEEDWRPHVARRGVVQYDGLS